MGIGRWSGSDAIGGVPAADRGRWDNPSPCERWTARGVVNHNVMVCVMIAEMTRGNPAAVPEGSVERAYAAPSHDGFVMAPHLLQRFVGPDDDPVVVWNRRRDDVLEALDQPGALQTETRSPWSHATVDAYLGLAFFDPPSCGPTLAGRRVVPPCPIGSLHHRVKTYSAACRGRVGCSAAAVARRTKGMRTED